EVASNKLRKRRKFRLSPPSRFNVEFRARRIRRASNFSNIESTLVFMSLQDAYQRLRPSTDIERCECASVESLLLIDLLSDNPIHCDYCRKEIDPERLQLTAEETHDIAHWFGAASALYRLWLDSGEYERVPSARQRGSKFQGVSNLRHLHSPMG